MQQLEVHGHYGPAYQVNDPGDGVIGQTLRTGEPYEAKLLYHIYRLDLPPGSLAVDAGAHIGNHTLWFAAACDLQVMAFEPVEYRKLCDNVALNSHLQGQVRTWPQALGKERGWARVKGKGELVHLMHHEPGAVPVVPLDSFEIENLALLKVDVEGWEPQVLLGAAMTIERCKPIIFAEARDAQARARNDSTLALLGYKKTGKVFGATPMWEWVPC